MATAEPTNAINKVVYGATVLVDLTEDTVTADKLAVGYTAHNKSGEKITGTYEGSGSLTASTVSVTGQTAALIYTSPEGQLKQGSSPGQFSIMQNSIFCFTYLSDTINLSSYKGCNPICLSDQCFVFSADSDYCSVKLSKKIISGGTTTG